MQYVTRFHGHANTATCILCSKLEIYAHDAAHVSLAQSSRGRSGSSVESVPTQALVLEWVQRIFWGGLYRMDSDSPIHQTQKTPSATLNIDYKCSNLTCNIYKRHLFRIRSIVVWCDPDTMLNESVRLCPQQVHVRSGEYSVPNHAILPRKKNPK